MKQVTAQDQLMLPDDLAYVGNNLKRPECVHCTRDGSIYTSNWQGGVTRIYPDGRQRDYIATTLSTAPAGKAVAQHTASQAESQQDLGIAHRQKHESKQQPTLQSGQNELEQQKLQQPFVRTNGFAITRQKSFLLANLGDTGGVWELSTQGELRPIAQTVDGITLPPTNYIMLDQYDQIWFSVSTLLSPRERAYTSSVNDGFIGCISNGKVRIAASGLGYVNEIQISPCAKYLYCNETFGRKLSRFRLLSRNELGAKEVVSSFGEGIYPDGLTFDTDYNAWITSIVSNTLIRVNRDGSQQYVLSDHKSDHVLSAEKAFAISGLERKHLDTTPAGHLKNISSLAFGGPNRDRAYLGCLLDSRIATFKTHTTGLKPYHWDIVL